MPGAEGEYNFDANGDGLHGYNIVRNEKGKIVFDKHIESSFLSAAPHERDRACAGSTGIPSRERLMDLALQLFFTGLGIGAVYALVALGFVLIFRATNVVNFAQGEFSMVGGLPHGRVRGRPEVALRLVIPRRARRHGAAWRRSSISAFTTRCATARSCP